MKRNHTNIFIATSSIALLTVLFIQVNWIFQTAKIKEELFNEKANMVLSRATEALLSDKETCNKIETCVSTDSITATAAKLGKNEVKKIDSLFEYYMKFYNFPIDYSFEIIKPAFVKHPNENGFANYSYNKSLEGIDGKNAVALKLIFPDKKQFIIAEMGTMFVTSVVLIIVVLVLFWRTLKSLMKEKIISEHTTDFLNNMTHEFKTPLTNIALAGKMMLRESTNQTDNKIKHFSGIILEENEKMRLQVDQMLSMTALERGEIPLQKNEIDFHELVTNAFKSMNLQLELIQVEIKLQLIAGKFIVLGDETHLRNAFINLIDNSIKYSNGKPEISVLTSNLGDRLIVTFSDKGIGIEKQYRSMVFDKFFRVPKGNVHDVKGFGLGLAYVKKIIELHRGTIELQSEYGEGTVIKITLPNE